MSGSDERKTPIPDGWGRIEPKASSRSSRSRKRITLSFQGPALELPSDALVDPLDPDEDSVEFELPALGAEDRAPVASPEPADAVLDGRDGWQLSRASPSSPPPRIRPRSERPAPGAPGESAESLRLVSARARPSSEPDLAADMADRFALGDFTGALRAAELILGQDPTDAEAALVADRARERLVHLHLARLGGLGAVLSPKVAGAEVRWLGLDHRAGFLLSLVDGATSVEEILDLSGMARHEALRLLAELLDGGAVERLR
ncbi:MAG: hypothetical protein OHK0013_39240 [Sandaracinaceae bacterium]